MHTIFLANPPRLARFAVLPEGATALPPDLVADLEAGIAAGLVLDVGGNGRPVVRPARWWWNAGTRGFYTESVHGAPPADSAEISAEEHAALLAGQEQGKLIADGGDGFPVLVDPPPLPLEIVKARALLRIDGEAERARQSFLTPGSGQALEYTETREEAALLLADQTPDPADYPMLEAERSALATVGTVRTLQEVAEEVRAQWQAWRTVGAAIKETRRTAKLQVEEAETAAEVAAVLDALSWPNH